VNPAVFLDRDGTLVEEAGYIDRVDRIVVFPYAVDAIRLIHRAGYLAVVVTNQAGVAKGIFPERFVEEGREYLAGRLAEGGEAFDGYYYCPHHPDGAVAAYRRECECRKPRTGMIDRAARDLDIDVSRSVTIGDKWIDVQLGQNAGARGILVKTGYGASEAARAREGRPADAVCGNLIEAVVWLLDHPAATR
jgi:D-glycero-D-manno-heptose 1,7-bisphosphate phosphatase